MTVVPGGLAEAPARAVLSPTMVRLVIVLVGSVQFFSNLQGSMLLPLGPLLARQLAFPVEHLGYVNSAYFLSAAVAGLIGSLCLDRFDRRTALSLALAGLAIGTAAAGFATNLEQLVICRIVAGFFGGPAAALGLAVISDATPVELRGRAIGAVSAGGGIALVLGVPIALLISEWVGVKGTFFAVSGVGAALTVAAAMLLPSGLSQRGPATGMVKTMVAFATMLRRRDTQLALSSGALMMSGNTVLAANLAAYFLYNLGSTPDDLKYLWAAGGVAGIVGGQVCGRLADRHGTSGVFWAVSLLGAVLYYVMFVLGGAGLPVMLLMCVFLICASGRMVLSNTISSLTPPPDQRGRFLSLMSATNQAAAAAAILAASHVLETAPSGALLHMDRIAAYSILTALLSPALASALAAVNRAR